ncbi:hypothetical protein M3Y98_00702400 [Aphelenchoides besseyi]|nr:hypothetical protein M3Y98_00702400 [Aphelenchoides besseyi]
MSVLILKIGLFVAMIVLTVLAGLFPIWLLKLLRKKAATAQSAAQKKYAAVVLCLLTCFSGGVFLATCFLHLFPELQEHLMLMQTEYALSFDYPLAELLSCCGFFVLFALEELVLWLIPSMAHGHSHSDGHHLDDLFPTSHASRRLIAGTEQPTSSCTRTECTTSLAEPERCETNCEKFREDPPILMKSQPHAHSHSTRSFTIVLAISFHAIIEGLAMGVQDDPPKVLAIFISLTVHKLIVAFSVGLQLARTHAHALKWVVISMVLIAVMTPLGGVLGMAVQWAPMSAELRDWIVLLCHGTAVGTFLYVTFFEVLIHERDNEHPNSLKLLMMLLGFALIGLIRLFVNADHGHSHGHSHIHDHN